MEHHISTLSIALKEYQKNNELDDVVMALIINELAAMNIRKILSNNLIDANKKASR